VNIQMALNKKNIIVGAARVYLGPSVSATNDLAAAKPAFVAGTRYTTTLTGANGTTTTGVGTLVTNWNEVGYTQDGLEVANDPSWGEVEVDQLLDSAKIFRDSMTINISTTFAEATLENLLIAWGQAATIASSGSTVNGTLAAGEREIDIAGGVLGEAPLERGLIAVGNATENAGTANSYGERVYQAYRVLSVESTSITNSRSEALTIPVTFRALPADNGRYGSVRDRLNVT
jgi:hypothetical protein